VILAVLWLPAGFVGFGFARLLDANWPFFLTTGGLMAAMAVVSVARLGAHSRWKKERARRDPSLE
jgi:hypothetical protein